MRSTAILFRRDVAPRAVLLTAEDDGLLVDYSGVAAGSDQIAWWRLARHQAEDGSFRVSQLGEVGWELRLNPGSDRALIERIAERRFGRWRSRLRKLGSLKLLLAVPVLAFTIAENMPARALATVWPEAAQERLTRGPMLSLSAKLCTRTEGQEALRALAERLDPALGNSVTMQVHNIPDFIMTALPGSTIEILRQPAVDTDAEQFAALLAHELSHVRNGDAMAAVLRENGMLSTLGLLLRGDDNRQLLMTYSGAEEDRADREAIAMLSRAGIPLAPAAALFERFRKAEASGDMFAAEQRNFHFGIGDRARQWAAAAARQGRVVSPISQQQADDLFNLCWAGPTEHATTPMPYPGQPVTSGRGTIGQR